MKSNRPNAFTRLTWLLLFISVILVYASIATKGSWEFVGDITANYYPLLSDAFVSGQLNLPVETPQAQLMAANPYDPELPKLYDATYYNGRYYLYYGPVPALIRGAIQWMTGYRILNNAPTFVYLLLTTLAFGAIVWTLQRRYFPLSPAWIGFVLFTLFAMNGVHMYLLADSGMYGEASSSASMFTMFTMLAFLHGSYNKEDKIRVFALAGLCAGLAAASRIIAASYGLALAFGIAAYLFSPERRQWFARLMAFAIPLGCIAFSYAAYNWARFDSPLEFGFNYLVGCCDYPALMRNGDAMNFKWAPAVLSAYFASWPSLIPTFPFLQFPQPTGLLFAERQISVLLLVPVLLIALILLPVALRNAAMRRLFLPLALGITLAIGLLSVQWGARFSYPQDFVPIMFVLCTAILLAVTQFNWAHTWKGRTLSSIVSMCVLAVGVVICIASLATGLSTYQRPPQLVFLERILRTAETVWPGRSGVKETLSSYDETSNVIWRYAGYYVWEAPIYLKSPSDKPALVMRLNSEAEELMTVQVRSPQGVDESIHHVEPHGNILVLPALKAHQGDTVVVTLHFQHANVPGPVDIWPRNIRLPSVALIPHEDYEHLSKPHVRMRGHIVFPTTENACLSEPIVTMGNPGNGTFIFLMQDTPNTIVLGCDVWGFQMARSGALHIGPGGVAHPLQVDLDAELWGARVYLDDRLVFTCPLRLHGVDNIMVGENRIGGTSTGQKFSGQVSLLKL